MDAKERHIVSELHQRIQERTFHELDVFALLIVLRAHTEAKSPMRELGDFIAHREKDRGLLKAYIQRVTAPRRPGAQHYVEINGVTSRETFCESLNETLSVFDLAPFAQEHSDDILVCCMSILQDVVIADKGTELGSLKLVRVHDELHLASKVGHMFFPAFFVPNQYCAPLDGWAPFTGLVEARCSGNLQLFVAGDIVP